MQQLLTMQHIYKAFFGVRVLNDVDFDLRSGEVHILLGENGAGKSTLIKILSGAYTLDSGEIVIAGQPVDPHAYTPKEAEERGIVTIYQHFHLVPHLSVAENVALSDFATRHGMIAWNTIYEQARRVLDNIRLRLDLRRKVQDLTVSQKQLLEIAIALSKHARILIMDEPTAALSKTETETLFDLIRDLKTKKIGIIYISHKLEEIQQIGDRVSVLRDGMNVRTLPVQNIDLNHVVQLMTGHEVQEQRSSRAFVRREPFVEFHDLASPAGFQEINFSIYPGEILGLTGLVGAGKTELARAVFGADALPEGQVRIQGTEVKFTSPGDAIRHGVGYLPEDRDVDGLCLNMGVKANVSLVFLAKLRALIFNNQQEKSLVTTFVNELRIKTTGLGQAVKYLSGGNKQKVVFAKWLAANCRLLILDEPTIGIDVGAREDLYQLIHEFVKTAEKSVLFISSDINEMLQVADRILVMTRGKIIREVLPAETTKQQILEYCLAVH
jgi:ribose transport system ATP-binding protein